MSDLRRATVRIPLNMAEIELDTDSPFILPGPTKVVPEFDNFELVLSGLLDVEEGTQDGGCLDLLRGELHVTSLRFEVIG